MNPQTLQDQILATPFVREKTPVTVPQWPGTDGKLFVKTLTALDDERYAGIVRRAQADPTVCVGAETAVLVLVDENDAPVFTAPDAAAKLASGGPEPLDAVFSAFWAKRSKRGDAAKK